MIEMISEKGKKNYEVDHSENSYLCTLSYCQHCGLCVRHVFDDSRAYADRLPHPFLPDFYAEEKITNIMDMERFKSLSQNENYQQLSIDIESSLVAEDENNYVIYVPGISDSKDEVLDCIVINKNDGRLSEDGKRVIAYLDKNKESSIHRFDKNGKEVKVFEMKNPDIALVYVKAESEKSLKKNASLIKSFNTSEKSKKITNNLIKSMGKKV